MSQRQFLEQIAIRAMRERGLEPEFPQGALRECAEARPASPDGLRDLRGLPWSSIDNDESRDLDQLEVLQPGPAGSTRLMVAIADVDALVHRGGATDDHARTNTTSIYTPPRVFPMLPEQLSTDKTSLLQDVDRAALVVQMDVTSEGEVSGGEVFRAVVCNHAKLAYDGISAWLEGTGPAPPGLAGGIDEQVRAQDRIAQSLRARRHERGALDFDRAEIKPVMTGDDVSDIRTVRAGRARDLIEEFMVAANGATARFLEERGIPAIRRVVRTPERWPRIVSLAASRGATLPATPDARALEGLLASERKRSPDTFDELSLAVIKLLGRGEYEVTRGQGSAQTSDGHFALAVSRYTHSTAPNRRYPDLLVQRLVKAALSGTQPPYSPDDLAALAAHCTRQEDAANKVERLVQKAAAALWLSGRIGQEFDGIVTGASSKGTWVRIRQPHVEGRVEKGFQGLDVGDRVRLRLISTDPERGFIDFARV